MNSTQPPLSALSYSVPPAVIRVLVVLGIAFAVQGWALRSDFYMDDYLHIMFNKDISSGELKNSGLMTGRVIPMFLWRQMYLSTGFNSTAYHVLNVLVHVGLAALLVSVLTSVAKLQPSLRAASQTIGFWGALIFACHPLVTEPVNYAAQLTILMATFFSVLTLWCYFRWRDSGKPLHLGTCALCVLLAGFSKEAGFWHALVNLFFVIMLTDGHKVFAFFEKRAVRLTLIGVLGVAGIAFATSWFGTILQQFSNGERLLHYTLTQSRVMFDYLGTMIVPVGLSSDHHIPWTISAKDTEALVKFILVIAGTLGILYAYLVKRRWLAAVVGMLLFHLLLRFFYTIDELMVEYRTYPSMPWVGLLFAFVLWKTTEGFKSHLRSFRLLGSSALVVLFSALSIQRSFVWHDADRLTLNVLEQYPTNMRALTIHYKHVSERRDFARLNLAKGDPDAIVAKIKAYNDRSGVRRYSELRRDLDYSSCQYYLTRAMIAMGEVEEGLRLSERMMVRQLNEDLIADGECLRQSFLSRALCAYFLGDRERLGQTIRLAGIRPGFQDAIRAMLKIEIQIAKVNQQVPLVASNPEQD